MTATLPAPWPRPVEPGPLEVARGPVGDEAARLVEAVQEIPVD